MNNLDNMKTLREEAKKDALLESADLSMARITPFASSETVSDYLVGSLISCPAYLRFTNVGRTSDFKTNSATNLLTLNKSSTTLQLRQRGFIQGGIYEPITQIFKYSKNRNLFSEYI